ncbi:MAG: PAS domain S-box protein [bacterium]|jgi:PAS domain S-box-containing protein
MSDFFHDRKTTLLTRLLYELPGLEAASKEAVAESVSRFLEEAVKSLDIQGAAIIIRDERPAETLAKVGIRDEVLSGIMECIEGIRAGGDASPAGALQPTARQTSTHVVLKHRDQTIIAFPFHSANARTMWSVFIPTDELPEDVRQTLFVISRHIHRSIDMALFMNDVQKPLEDLDKRTQELKEMEVSSLNMMEDLQRKNRELHMLNQIIYEISKYTDLATLTSRAVEAASSICDGAGSYVYVFNEDAGVFVPYITAAGADIVDRESVGIRSSSRLMQRMLASDEIPFNPKDPDFDLPIIEALKCKSFIGIPLKSKERVLGFLFVYETRWHRIFTSDEKANLKALASTLAVAMENAGLISKITEQMEELSVLKEYVEAVVESVDLGILVVDKSLNITMFNKGFEKLYGYKKEEFLGRKLFDAFSHLKAQGFDKIAAQVLGGTPFIRHNWRRSILDGRERVQNIRVFPHRDARGTIIGGVIIIEDITEKANLENQLAQSEAKFKNLVEDLADGYFIAINGKVAYGNKAAIEMTGLGGTDLIGIEAVTLFDPDFLFPSPGEELPQTIRSETKLVHSTGTWIPVEVTVNACNYEGSDALSVVVRDITERKKFDNELQQKNREMGARAEQITRLNLELESTVQRLKESQENLIESERLAAMTETAVAANHEINNPLFSILGQSQLLIRKYGTGDEETFERLKAIEEAALRIACVTKKLANLVDPVIKEYPGTKNSMIDLESSVTKPTDTDN